MKYHLISAISLTDKPSPPRNLHGTETFRDFIVVAWEVPESDGGSPITQYKVERRSTTKNSWIVVGTTKPDTLTIKASKLTEGHEYDFRVVAENDIGVSDPCQTEAPIMAKLPFGEYYFICLSTYYIWSFYFSEKIVCIISLRGNSKALCERIILILLPTTYQTVCVADLGCGWSGDK